MPEWNSNELTLPAVAAIPGSEPAIRLAVTILFHPELQRIGELAILPAFPGNWVESISRLEPLFASPDNTGAGNALSDPYLSRTPLKIQAEPAGVRLQSAVDRGDLRLDGLPLQGEPLLGWERLRRGVVLSLAHRIVLLLHPYSPETDSGSARELVGDCAAMRRLRNLVGRVAATDTPVLLLGETGTGKELVARAIHDCSARAAQPLVSVNMAALPGELAAAELFGVQRGAYTGADCDRPGYFRQAQGGTLFLDEIGACGANIQPQLLRALQEGEIQTPGGAVQSVDVRVVAATDAELDAAGTTFSSALRHRLAGFEIRLPPLRARREDLGRLLQHFLPPQLLAVEAEEPVEVSRRARLVEKMALYAWPGNVRELANVCGQLVIAAGEAGRLVIPDSLQHGLFAEPVAGAAQQAAVAAPSDSRVREAMLAARWEVAEAARELQISRQALYRRIENIPGLRVAADITTAEVEVAYHECQGDIDLAAMQLQVSRAALRRRWRAMDLTPGGV